MEFTEEKLLENPVALANVGLKVYKSEKRGQDRTGMVIFNLSNLPLYDMYRTQNKGYLCRLSPTKAKLVLEDGATSFFYEVIRRCTVYDLNFGFLLSVFCYLGKQDLSSVACVCRSWRAARLHPKVRAVENVPIPSTPFVHTPSKGSTTTTTTTSKSSSSGYTPSSQYQTKPQQISSYQTATTTTIKTTSYNTDKEKQLLDRERQAFEEEVRRFEELQKRFQAEKKALEEERKQLESDRKTEEEARKKREEEDRKRKEEEDRKRAAAAVAAAAFNKPFTPSTPSPSPSAPTPSASTGGPVCAKCSKPLSGSVVEALGKEFHENCFTCDKCNKPLPGAFANIGGKPVCSNCARAANPSRLASRSETAPNLNSAGPIRSEPSVGQMGLMPWVQNRTRDYPNVEVKNWTKSWQDGLAFCALLHSYYPDKIAYSTLSPNNPKQNIALAYKVANELGIPELLEEEDFALEKLSMMTYMSEVYKKLGMPK